MLRIPAQKKKKAETGESYGFLRQAWAKQKLVKSRLYSETVSKTSMKGKESCEDKSHCNHPYCLRTASI